MCGRFVRKSNSEEISDLFGLKFTEYLQPKYNESPGKKILSIRKLDTLPEYVFIKWGFSVKTGDNKISALVNARSETVLEKPAFTEHFKQRRCLIPMDGFYEWEIAGNARKPHYFSLKSEKPFGVAALYHNDEVVILTTSSNSLLDKIHQRMPVIIEGDKFQDWLDPEANVDELIQLCQPYSPDLMQEKLVSSYVNNANNEGEKCLEEADPVIFFN
jgi:putative SOS response-associated peptidase YedK